MALRYVLDEQLRGPVWNAIQSFNQTNVDAIDATRVGDPPDLPCGTSDPDLLLWAAQQKRVVISFDWRTMKKHLAAHLAAGHHSAGLFLVLGIGADGGESSEQRQGEQRRRPLDRTEHGWILSVEPVV